MKIYDFFQLVSTKIRESGSLTPRLDTDLLFRHYLGLTSVEMMTKDQESISSDKQSEIEIAVNRRCRGEPIAYILGTKEFYGRAFHVGPGVLVPRPETEHLVEEGLHALFNRPTPRIADFGAGSGCIGFSLLLETQGSSLVAVEKSKEAIRFLEKNCAQYDLEKRAMICQQGVEDVQSQESFDLIVANPPYVSQNDQSLHPWVRLHEPAIALFSEEGGIRLPKEWIKKGLSLLKPNGVMLVEIGSAQGQELTIWVNKNFPSVFVTLGKDLAGLDRYLKLVNNPGSAESKGR